MIPPSLLHRHRGGLILTLGLLSFVLCFPIGPACGIIAWILGTQDLRAMRAGTMDPAGRGSTEAGRILGLVGTLLVVVLAMIWCVFLVLGMAAASAVR